MSTMSKTTGDLKEVVLQALIKELEGGEELQASIVNAAVNFLKAFHHEEPTDAMVGELSGSLKKYAEQFEHKAMN